ncbi:MAG: PHP domain-containing protein [Deltaproteobacteria bacterium]|nr:PHP domain-containing protein [Deltaproteobacteria bacterium]
MTRSASTRLDFHFHSSRSFDAQFPIQNAYRWVVKHGFDALVVTDHVYPYSANPYRDGVAARTHGTYRKSVSDAAKIVRQNDVPILVGMELLLPENVTLDHTELLIFGTELCEHISVNLKEVSTYNFRQFCYFLNTYRDKSAIVFCHPYAPNYLTFQVQAEFIRRKLVAFAPVLDAVEIGLRRGFNPHLAEIATVCHSHGLTMLANSDGHELKSKFPGCSYLYQNYNIFDSPAPTTEAELIRLIKQQMPAYFVIDQETYSLADVCQLRRLPVDGPP